MRYNCLSCLKHAMTFVLVAAAAGSLSGCAYDSTATHSPTGESSRRVIPLKEISPEQGQAFLSKLGFGEISITSERDALVVRGAPGDLYRAAVVMDLVDTRDEFCIAPLASVSDAATVPANSRTAAALGGIAIGTFANPPQPGERTRAIIDVHGSWVVAVVPVRIQKDLLAFIKSSLAAPQQTTAAPVAQEMPDESSPAQAAVSDSNETADASSTQTASSVPAAASPRGTTGRDDRTAGDRDCDLSRRHNQSVDGAQRLCFCGVPAGKWGVVAVPCQAGDQADV